MARTLRILTFNVWFSDYEMPNRMKSIGNIIGRRRPHVVALQEMKPHIWAQCLKSEAFQQYHWTTAPDAQYYTMIGSRVPFATQPRRTRYPQSKMARDFLATVIDFRDPELPPFLLGVSHFESCDSANERKCQMHEVFQQMDSFDGEAIFCGDTNIDEKGMGNSQPDGVINLPFPWVDPWELLHPGDPGYTHDVELNGMLKRKDRWAREARLRTRFDRFWLRLNRYRPVSIELEGNRPLRDYKDVEGHPVWPSDHFAVLLTLQADARQ